MPVVNVLALGLEVWAPAAVLVGSCEACPSPSGSAAGGGRGGGELSEKLLTLVVVEPSPFQCAEEALDCSLHIACLLTKTVRVSPSLPLPSPRPSALSQAEGLPKRLEPSANSPDPCPLPGASTSRPASSPAGGCTAPSSAHPGAETRLAMARTGAEPASPRPRPPPGSELVLLLRPRAGRGTSNAGTRPAQGAVWPRRERRACVSASVGSASWPGTRGTKGSARAGLVTRPAIEARRACGPIQSLAAAPPKRPTRPMRLSPRRPPASAKLHANACIVYAVYGSPTRPKKKEKEKGTEG